MGSYSAMNDDAVQWFADYTKRTTDWFLPRFTDDSVRFTCWEALFSRFRDAVARVEDRWDPAALPQVSEFHNEMCIADAILSSSGNRLRCQCLEYEPALPGCARTIDFRVHTEDEFTVYVDVKTVKPLPTDRWGQYQRALRDGWIPDNVKVDLFRDGGGGEIWHGWFAARSRMLEYSIEMESKIADAGLGSGKVLLVLVLCSSGWEWHQDRLEDFVHFYRTGTHRGDDAFSQMELDHIRKTGASLARTISCFAYMERPDGCVGPRRLNWDVQSPPQPWLEVG